MSPIDRDWAGGGNENGKVEEAVKYKVIGWYQLVTWLPMCCAPTAKGFCFEPATRKPSFLARSVPYRHVCFSPPISQRPG